MVPVQEIVSVLGFCLILFLYPMPIPLFPLVAALAFPTVAAEAAWVGFHVGLYLGTPYALVRVGLDGGK